MRGRLTFVKRAQPGAPRQGSGFGFITDEQGKDRFFSHSSVVGTAFDQLKEGLDVEFEPYEEPIVEYAPGKRRGGLRAREVRVVG